MAGEPAVTGAGNVSKPGPKPPLGVSYAPRAGDPHDDLSVHLREGKLQLAALRARVERPDGHE